MRIVNFEEIIINKRYYIEVPETNYSENKTSNRYKVSGRVMSISSSQILFWNLKYVNSHYDDIKPLIKGKPILLRLYKNDNKMYRIMNSTLPNELIYKKCTNVYEIENEKMLTNMVLRKIIGDPYFDFTI